MVQNILLSTNSLANEKVPSEMYLRGAPAGSFLAMTPGVRVDFDTYFNSFSLEKWTNATSLSRLTLALELAGCVTVELTGLDWHDGCLKKTSLAVETFYAPEREEVLLDYPAGVHTLVAFSLFPHDGAVLYNGRYFAEAGAGAREVDLALVTCTYKKEDFVKRNVDLLLGVEGLSVFVVDNGRTLDSVLTPSGNLHIYPNRNAGGSGGFTRGILEVLSSGRAYTHILLMDDDVSVNAESIQRLKSLLSLLREDMADAVVGGAMLRRDRPSIQEENGAWIVADAKEGVRQISEGRFTDLRSLKAIVKNEGAENAPATGGRRYQPWYFCCFPVSAIGTNNLPLPLFIRGDDVEYSLRNFKKFINMNGLCVWHESFEKKSGSMLHYYVNRNLYIIMAFSMALSRKNVVLRMLINLRNQLYRYDYNSADAILDAFSDFLAGPRHLARTPPESTLKRQSGRNDRMTPCRAEPARDEKAASVRNKRDFPPGILKRLVFRLTLGGHWVPSAFFTLESAASEPYGPWRCFLKKRLRVTNYDGRREWIREIDRWRCLRIAARCFFLRVYSIFRYEDLRQEWKKNGPRLTREKFWRRILGI
jgi:GT2 family glycosyltransferase